MAASSRSTARCAGTCGKPHPVQQRRDSTQGVTDVEHASDQIGYPRQRPALILGVAVRCGTLLQRSSQPSQPPLIQPATPTARPLGNQPRPTTSFPAPPPHLHRVGRHPQPGCDLRNRHLLRKPLRSTHPHRLTFRPTLGGQPTTVRIPHHPGIDHQLITPEADTPPRPTSTVQDL